MDPDSQIRPREFDVGLLNAQFREDVALRLAIGPLAWWPNGRSLRLDFVKCLFISLVLLIDSWHNERVHASLRTASREELIAELQRQERENEQLRRERDRYRQERDRLRKKIDRLEDELDDARRALQQTSGAVLARHPTSSATPIRPKARRRLWPESASADPSARG